MRTPDFWYEKDGILSTALTPLSWGYNHFSQKRIHKKPRYRAKIPVICVGNLTAGGSGKTPVVRAVAHFFTELGKTPHILSRGYGANLKSSARVDHDIHTAREVGDEAFIHAKYYNSWISPDRVKGAKKIEHFGDADLIIMDDGFQNPFLHKDLNLVVVDGNRGFGNEKLIPAGPLREPIDDGIKRADALIIVGDDRHYFKERFSYLLPVFQAHLLPKKEEKNKLQNQPIVAFSGIGLPEKFRQTLLSLKADIKSFTPFPDHHFFTLNEINKLLHLAKKHDAALVTTEKDWGRLPDSYQKLVTPIFVEIVWKDEDAVKNFLQERIKP